MIVLDGSLSGFGVTGLTITAGNSTVRGLVINHFGYADGIALLTNGGNRIVGNYIGTDVTGTITVDFHVGQFGVAVHSGTGNIIGGTTAADRNVISSSPTGGIFIRDSFTVVQGTTSEQMPPDTSTLAPGWPNSVGVRVQFAAETLIGGTSVGCRQCHLGQRERNHLHAGEATGCRAT